MTRFAAILLALSLAPSAALAASPEAAYLAARDKAIAEIKALEDAKASESAVAAAEDKASADLTKRLKDIVGPVAVKDLPPHEELAIALSPHQEGYGNLDGLSFFDDKGDEALLVTTRPLLAAWLEGRAKEKDRAFRLPADVDAAARQDDFYTFSVHSDVAFAKYADLPVTKPPGASLAVAALGEFTQGFSAGLPDSIVATVVKGDRVVVAGVRRETPVAKIPACAPIWARAQRKQADVDDPVERDYRGCFSARAAKERFFDGLTQEAQRLVDRLAGE